MRHQLIDDLVDVHIPPKSYAEQWNVEGLADARIAQEGRGVLVLIRDVRARAVSEWVTGRGAGKSGISDDERKNRQVETGVGSQILADLGLIGPLR